MPDTNTSTWVGPANDKMGTILLCRESLDQVVFADLFLNRKACIRRIFVLRTPCAPHDAPLRQLCTQSCCLHVMPKSSPCYDAP